MGIRPTATLEWAWNLYNCSYKWVSRSPLGSWSWYWSSIPYRQYLVWERHIFAQSLTCIFRRNRCLQGQWFPSPGPWCFCWSSCEPNRAGSWRSTHGVQLADDGWSGRRATGCQFNPSCPGIFSPSSSCMQQHCQSLRVVRAVNLKVVSQEAIMPHGLWRQGGAFLGILRMIWMLHIWERVQPHLDTSLAVDKSYNFPSFRSGNIPSTKSC